MLACRLCRIALSAQVGCSICDPIRRHLVVVGEDDDDRPSLSGTGSETVAVLRTILRQVKQDLSVNPTSPSAQKAALAVGNTLAKVLEAARKLQADGTAAVEAMSFQERKELMVGWYTDLAPAYRNAVREALTQYEVDVAKPLKTEAEPTLS